MIQDKNVTAEVAWRMIAARDKQEPTQGYQNLAILANCKGDIEKIPISLLKLAYSDDKWQRNEQEFKKANQKLISLL